MSPPCSWSFLTAKENIEHRVNLHLWGWSYNKTLQIDRDSTIESEINSTALPSTKSLQHRANQDMSFDHSEVISINKSYNGHTLIKVLSNGTFFPERGRDGRILMIGTAGMFLGNCYIFWSSLNVCTHSPLSHLLCLFRNVNNTVCTML